MTRNRNRKDKARQLQRETGARRAAASREHSAQQQHAQPMQDLLASAAAAVANADPAELATFLPAAWQAVCVIGAGAELLAECAGTRDCRARLYLAREPLDQAVEAMRATPALRSAPAEVNPAGSPGDQLSESEAQEIRSAIAAACDTLADALSRVPCGVRPPSAARACRTAQRSAQRISSIYQVPPAPPADDGGAAAARPCYLDTGIPEEMETAIGAHLRELHTTDPADTTAALVAAWYAFSLTFALGQFLAARSPDLAVLHENATRSWELVLDAMDAAPSLPDGLHPLGLNTVPYADPALMNLVHQGVWDLTLALNWLLPQVAEHAGHAADAAVARDCTALSAELGDCYSGRLKTFLNLLGRPPGARSAVIRTQPRQGSKRRGAASSEEETPGPDR